MWSTVQWLDNLDMVKCIANALLGPLVKAAGRRGVSKSELAFVAALGDASTSDEILTILASSSLLQELAEVLFDGARKLSRPHAEGGGRRGTLANRFVAEQEDANTLLTFGSFDQFYGGIEAIVGPPNVKVYESMETEHCRAEDSDISFVSPNYLIRTTSKKEWHLVVNPSEVDVVPREEARRGSSSQLIALPTFATRKRQPLSDFDRALRVVNDKLAAVGANALGKEE